MNLQNYENFKSITSAWENEIYDESQSVVLILPDALRTKFYLNDKRSKKNQEQLMFQKEMKRFERICRKEAEEKFPIHSTHIVHSTKVYKSKRILWADNIEFTVTYLVFRDIENRIIGPYRKNPVLYNDLLTRINKPMKRSPRRIDLIEGSPSPATAEGVLCTDELEDLQVDLEVIDSAVIEQVYYGGGWN